MAVLRDSITKATISQGFTVEIKFHLLLLLISIIINFVHLLEFFFANQDNNDVFVVM